MAAVVPAVVVVAATVLATAAVVGTAAAVVTEETVGAEVLSPQAANKIVVKSTVTNAKTANGFSFMNLSLFFEQP
jgi:UDP-glucose 4-epimerase